MSIIDLILPTSVSRALGLAFLPRLIQKGWSGNKALNWLKGKGVGYKRQDFQTDWRRLVGIEKKKDTLKYVKRTAFPTTATMELTDENLSAKYKLTYKINVIDKETLQKETLHISIVSDRKMSMGQWDDIAEDLIFNEKYSSQYEVADFTRESMLEKIMR